MELQRRLPSGIRVRLQTLSALPPVRFLLRLATDIGADDVSGLAAEMAYRLLFALFPFMIFLTAVIGFISARVGFDNLFALVMRLVTSLVPPEIGRLLSEWVAGVL